MHLNIFTATLEATKLLRTWKVLTEKYLSNFTNEKSFRIQTLRWDFIFFPTFNPLYTTLTEF